MIGSQIVEEDKGIVQEERGILMTKSKIRGCFRLRFESKVLFLKFTRFLSKDC